MTPLLEPSLSLGTFLSGPSLNILNWARYGVEVILLKIFRKLKSIVEIAGFK